MSLTKDQKAALNTMNSGQNVFLTGYAGTGKSYVLRKFISQHHNLLVTAPTGIAALNVGGTTLHRLLKLRPSDDLQTKEAKKNPKIAHAKILIIDEISMCRRDLFDFLCKTIRKSNKNIQLICVGDFCQLPPVVTSKERDLFPEEGSEYAFKSDFWVKLNFANVLLTKIIRQKNKAFTKALNKIRLGDAKGLDYINKHSSKTELKGALTLCGTNKTATTINQNRLRAIHEKPVEFFATTTGKVEESDKPNADQVTLKKSARVVFLINDTNNSSYSNGTMGTVKALLDDNQVLVTTDAGDDVLIEPTTWSIYGYELKHKVSPKTGKKLKKKVLQKVKIGSFTQIPLKPAYAVTVHKSQGQTYKQVNFKPQIFVSGQLYVALSRVEDVKQLFLLEPLTPDMVRLDSIVKDFYQNLDDNVQDKRKKWGGKRKGAGRKPKSSVPTVPMRVPKDLKSSIEAIKKRSPKQLAEINKLLVSLNKWYTQNTKKTLADNNFADLDSIFKALDDKNK